MSAITKRKHVVKEMLDDFNMPTSNQTIVQVLGTSGSNLHQIRTAHGERFLASLPTKFRKNIWIKRGDYVIIEPIAEGHKVKAEIVRILYPQHIKEIKQCDQWPDQFQTRCNEYKYNAPTKHQIEQTNSEDSTANTYDSSEESEDDFSDIPVNTNRPPEIDLEDSDEETTSDED